MILFFRILFGLSVFGLLFMVLTKKHRSPKGWLVIGACLIVAVGSVTGYKLTKHAHDRTAASAKQASQPKISSVSGAQVENITAPATGKLTSYDIVSDTPSQLIVFSKEKDAARLVQLNDQLYQTYGQNKESFRIDYFDDAGVAKDYFSAVTKPGITVDEQQRLKSHYTAFMIVSASLKRKEFDRQGAPLQTLKKY